MMKGLMISIISIAFSLTCFSQSLFFDNLETSTWMSAFNFSDSLMQNSTDIPLARLTYSEDSIRKNVTLWNFKEGVLTITALNVREKKETLIATYPYNVNRNKGLLIIDVDNEFVAFDIGITSTGNNALLIRKKEKKRKKKVR